MIENFSSALKQKHCIIAQTGRTYSLHLRAFEQSAEVRLVFKDTEAFISSRALSVARRHYMCILVKPELQVQPFFNSWMLLTFVLPKLTRKQIQLLKRPDFTPSIWLSAQRFRMLHASRMYFCRPHCCTIWELNITRHSVKRDTETSTSTTGCLQNVSYWHQWCMMLV